MKKILLLITGGVILIGGGVIFWLVNKQVQPITSSEQSQSSSYTTYDACQLLTKEKADQLLKTTTTLSEESAPASSDDLKVTNCTYNNNAGNFRDIVSVSILVRSPLTSTGAESNEEAMKNPAIVGDTGVSGYGDKATWNQTMGQLNILKDNNWIIITFGKVQPAERNLEEAKQAADVLL